jgi:HSP20 family protein
LFLRIAREASFDRDLDQFEIDLFSGNLTTFVLISINDRCRPVRFYDLAASVANAIVRRRNVMAEAATKFPVKNETQPNDRPAPGRPFENFRREMDRLFDDFQWGSWRSPFGRTVFDVEPFWRGGEVSWAKAPAVDVVEQDKAYEITAELPGMDESNIDVKFADGVLTIKGEKKEEKEERKKDQYLSERRYGSFQRTFRVPDGVDADQIAASFKNGVLSVTLPKTAQAVQSEKKIPIAKA